MKALLLTFTLLPTLALGADPTADEILAKYDAVMGPSTFESQAEMTATREDGSTRTYAMRFLKRDADKFRVWFAEPASVKGQEVLRLGDNAWVYLPNLKRATRIANRDSFQGGDFNNADVLRVNYRADYDAKLVDSPVPDTWALKLKAKTPETAYDAITLIVRKRDLQPVRGEYYGTSGQLIRSATFSDWRELDKGFVRPARVVMQNEVVKARKTEMVTRTFKVNVDAPPQRFMQADLGK
ncbi:MAG: outer membrane lipoprotein-sorting protein [Myxococcaceae bacterium]|jgi:outer membrane lipoprotein-sorting protein|nr:outer membrane lipoprotein-sorting protein [Myxococcaceae bacterium]MCA3013284.1 outer membrane lipoprotein-sorting protein [Myxococcaceae bacterium]